MPMQQSGIAPPSSAAEPTSLPSLPPTSASVSPVPRIEPSRDPGGTGNETAKVSWTWRGPAFAGSGGFEGDEDEEGPERMRGRALRKEKRLLEGVRAVVVGVVLEEVEGDEGR